jgi:GNAT superfamily N-acetyltransferase
MEDNATMPGESAKSTDDFTFAEKDNGKPAADKQSQIDQNENPTTEIESKNDWKNHPLALKPLVYSGAEDRRRKSLLTVAFATIEGGLRANVDPTITERSLLVSNDADQNTANFSGSSLRPSIVRSEVGKFGIHFREEEVKEEVEEDPKGIPIPGGPFDKQDEKEIDEDRPSPVYPGPSAPKSLGHYVKGKFIQTQLDLGPDARKSCSVCQMIYNSTDERDILSHKEFHKNYVEGCSIGSLKTDIPNHPRKLQYNIDENGVEEYIVKVDRFTAASWTRLAENVLRDYVDADLGNRSHGDITRLWGERADPDLARDALEATYFNLNTVQSANAGIPRVPSYAVFLYIRNKRVISVLVAERIKEGKGLSRIQMEEDDFGKWPKEVVMLVDDFKDSSPAWLGVDRIWTHKKCRGKGYAFRLLETARFNCFIFGNYIHRKEVAFSYTTYLGTKFAKSYHREEEFDYVFYDNNESLLPDI